MQIFTKKKTLSLFIVLISILVSNPIYPQMNIAKMAAAADKENPRYSELKRVKLGTYKYAYYDVNYTKVYHNKYVYFINTEDEKIIEAVDKVFRGFKINVINFHNIRKPADYTEEQLKDLFKSRGIDGFIQINLTSDVFVLPSSSTFIQNFGTFAVGLTNAKKNLVVTTYVDFFDDLYGESPFIRVIATSESSRPWVEYKLVGRNLSYMLDRLVNKYEVIAADTIKKEKIEDDKVFV